MMRVTPSILLVPAAPGARTVCEDLVEGFSSEKVRVKLAGEKSDAVACVKEKGPERTRCLTEALEQAKADGLVLVSAVVRGQQTLVTLQLHSRTAEPQRQEVARGPKARVAAFARPAVARTMNAFRALLAQEEKHRAEAEAAQVTASAPLPTASPAPPGRSSARDAPLASGKVEPKEITLTFNNELALPSAPPAARRSPVPGWIAAGVAVAAIGVAAAFTGLALSSKSRLDMTTNGLSTLSYTEATQLKDQTNLDLSIALGAGITVLAAGGVAGVLWVK